MGSVFRQRWTKRDPTTGEKRTELSRKWYVQFRDASGKLVRRPAYTDKQASLHLLARLERESAHRAEGIIDRHAEHRARKLAEHVADWAQHLRDRGTKEHGDKSAQRVLAILSGASITHAEDATASRVEGWLAQQRRAGALSAGTSNGYLRSIKGFFNWLVDEDRIAATPLRKAKPLPEDIDRRRVRRSLSAADLSKLIETTSQSTLRRKLSGPARALLYVLAASTGFRRNELASITPSFFDWDAAELIVPATWTKNRQQGRLPLRNDVLTLCRRWVDSQRIGPRQPLLACRNSRTAEWLAADLIAAGISPEDEAGRVVDFHSLRETFVTGLAVAGVHPRVAQKLARHSTIVLTMKRYTDAEAFSARDAVESLPSLPAGLHDSLHQSLALRGSTRDKMAPTDTSVKKKCIKTSRKKPPKKPR